ncbi:hypothetical protein V6Z12_A08G279900 [Gossypium hirsutum]
MHQPNQPNQPKLPKTLAPLPVPTCATNPAAPACPSLCLLLTDRHFCPITSVHPHATVQPPSARQGEYAISKI